MIKMSDKSFKKEHHKLVAILKNPTKKKLTKEAKEQEKELVKLKIKKAK